MKNFTNNFKQFTSRLSARWLIMALMLLVGTSSALAKIFYSGDIIYVDATACSWYESDGCNASIYFWGTNSTGPTHMTRIAERIYSYTFTSQMNVSNFKVFRQPTSSSGWTNEYNGFEGDFNSMGSYNTIKVNSSSNDFSWSTYTPPVTYTATIKYKRPSGWSNTPNIHLFNNGCTGSPFVNNQAMTLLGTANDGSVWYKYDYTVTTTCGNATIMFNNGGWSNGQTNENLTLTWGEDYCLTGASSTNVTSVTCPVFCTEPQASDFTYTAPSNLTYNGSAKSATVTWKSGTGSGTITKYYKSGSGSYSTTAPTNVGTYTVAVKTAAGGNYCATNDYVEVGSFTITCLQPAASNFTYTAPSNLTYNGSAKSATVTWKSGTGSGTITKYYKSGAGSYSTTAPTNVGTYTVAVKTVAGGNYCATNDYVEVGSFTITCAQPTASNFTYTAPSNLTYNGSAKSATVTWKSGTGSGTITKYYKSGAGSYSTTAPTNVGTYTVAVKTVAGGNYCATEDYVEVGSFTIEGKDPIESDFTYTNSKDYTGSALSADVAWKTGLAAGVGGAITTYYKVEGTADNTYTTTVPTAVGTYTVAVTTAAGGNYAAATQKIVLGEFTINEVCDPITNLTWSITSGSKTTYCPGDKVEVTLTYKGSEAKAHAWGGNWSGNIDILPDDYATGTVYTMTINKSGSVDLTLTGCDSETATTETLYFTVATAPAAPQLLPSGTINVGQNKSTTITVNNMDANATYACYNANDQEVGTWNGNSVTFNVGDATGNFTYSIVATDKTCGNLTATTEFTIKVEEAGVKIAALGSTVLYNNDPTHFIPMYVSNEDLAGVGATSVKKYTWQFSANGTSGWTDCTRNYGNFNAANNQSNGNVVVTNGSKNCNNWRANQAGYYRCKLTYDNDEEQVSGNIQVTEATNNNTNKQHIGITYNLPIISVNTGANSFPSDAGLATKSSNCGSSKYPSIHADKMKEKISVDVMMFNPDRTICYDRKARMNYRGSSSLNFQKKSYAFVTGKEKTKNLDGDVDTGKANLFGLSNGAEDKDWVLYAATPDPSMMRNRLVFDLYQKMRPGEWGVNSMYVELVVNGEYRGVYVLMDKITCNANRVNIKNENGFIVKFDKTDVVDRVENTDGDQKTFATSRTGTKNSSNGIESYGSCIDQRFEIEYPEKEDIELWDAFYGNVQQRFENFETALANKDYATVRTLIDYDSWADWFIITELAKNQDGFRASCIFVYDGYKIEARPLWDQELSFNNGTRVKHGIDSPDGLIITTSSVYNDAFYPPFWFTGHKGTSVTGGLLNDPCFVSLVKQKWATYQSGVCSAASIGNMVADYNTELGNAINREAARWPYTEAARGTTTDGDYIGYYSQGEGNPSQYSYAASKSAITAWASDRSTALTAGSGLGKAINALNGEALIFTLSPSSVETTPWQQVMITVNAPDGYEYTFDDSSINNATVKATVKKSNDTYAIKIPRPSAWGVGGNGNPGTQTQYQVSATIEVSGENQCGTIQNGTATSTITLTDVTENCNPEIVKP